MSGNAIFSRQRVFPLETAEQRAARHEEISHGSKDVWANAKKVKEQFWDTPTSSPLVTKDNYEIYEITQAVIGSDLYSEEQKTKIVSTGRRIYLLVYQSDALKIKAVISTCSNEKPTPLVYHCRGGNNLFGLPYPTQGAVGNVFSNATLVCSSYRGEVCEGLDEFGGGDVNDVKNLVDIFSEVKKDLGLKIDEEQVYMLGGSRGGLQMMLTLTRFPEIQEKIKRAIFLSGVTDVKSFMEYRDDISADFETSHLSGKTPEEINDWKQERNPCLHLDKLSKELPFLILNGGKDARVDPETGVILGEKLQELGCNVSVWNVMDGNHCLINRVDVLRYISNWVQDLAFRPSKSCLEHA